MDQGESDGCSSSTKSEASAPQAVHRAWLTADTPHTLTEGCTDLVGLHDSKNTLPSSDFCKGLAEEDATLPCLKC